eukprot:scaffold69143_cov58-Phaeocystis_antarctica.AAC.1
MSQRRRNPPATRPASAAARCDTRRASGHGGRCEEGDGRQRARSCLQGYLGRFAAARLKAHTPRAPRGLQPCSSPLTRDARSVRKRSSRHTARPPSTQAGPASALRSGSDTITPMPSKLWAIYSAEVEGAGVNVEVRDSERLLQQHVAE